MKKLHTEPSNTEDIISKLPNEILAHILTKLPIQDAVRTSSLTKRWRHIYTEMPRLQFIMKDSDRADWTKDSDGSASNEWLSIIDRGLLKVQGLELIPPLQKVELTAGKVDVLIRKMLWPSFSNAESGRLLSLATHPMLAYTAQEQAAEEKENCCSPRSSVNMV
ncbi:putative F-box protein [Acorus gramineus]|uniref:F-box protein n=1 Tax=Acorus gramineus TaxID=55184 RepID=A0AAV9BL85_ACOGR|nr:putative F-box protein [Acorus gramineus]